MIYTTKTTKRLSIFVVPYHLFVLYIMSDVSNSTTFDCFTNLKSVCPNNVLTQWNKRQVGESLKLWIKSVSLEKLGNHSATFWKNQGHEFRGQHCKSFSITKNKYHLDRNPGLYSTNVTRFGKVTHDDDGSDFEFQERKYVGPVWFTINDPFEWNFDHTEGGVSGLAKNATIHNGIYYIGTGHESLGIGKSAEGIFVNY